MTPFYQDNHIRIFNKDCRSMGELPDESVQCVITSPPYFGLRKYAGEQDLIWGGDKDCEHEWVSKEHKDTRGVEGSNLIGRIPYKEGEARTNYTDGFCSLCGSWRGQLGLEPTPELYLLHLIEIMREIRRVLRKDGVFFLNIGDSYAGSGSPGGDFRDGKGGDEYLRPYNRKGGVLKPKDLCLIPQRLMIAAQSTGWWVRSVIIWSKQNPMPESVNGWRWSRHRIRIDENGKRVTKGGRLVDCPGCESCLANDGLWLYKGSWRPTESHEYILMLTKSDQYYCDADAVREPYTEPLNRWGGDTLKRDTSKTAAYKEMQNIGYSSAFRVGRPMRPDSSGRNIRSVWTFPTTPFPSFKIEGKDIDHFAVFPEKLPELCIKAATPEGCCSKCGAPWARIVERHGSGPARKERKNKDIRLTRIAGQKWQDWKNEHPDKTLGWKPTCTCNAPRVPSLVLDPMMGAGTTLLVAKNLNRYAVGYEMSQEYCGLALERCRQQVLL